VLDQLALDSDGFEIETVMNIRVLRAKLRVVEVPSFEYRRIYGSGRLKVIPDGWSVLKSILAERFKRKAVVGVLHLAHDVETPTEADQEAPSLQ
jgi:hypothetical protein